MQVQPYLFFGGRCEEAIDFYRRALGAEVAMLMPPTDAPPARRSFRGFPCRSAHPPMPRRSGCSMG